MTVPGLWKNNLPLRFWSCSPALPDEVWQAAYQKAYEILGLGNPYQDIETTLELVLGEGQFGAEHWKLSTAKRAYYQLKPFIPRAVTRVMRQVYQRPGKTEYSPGWPIEDRYARFLWQVLVNVMEMTAQPRMEIAAFWPEGKRCALVLTHDIEADAGQAFVRQVADLEERLGFRSSFNFIPEKYALDRGLIEDLRKRGFEVGLHGLKHDGKLFSSREEFTRRAKLINHYLGELDMVGFRAPLTHRHPQWMQDLDLEYDLSFFDTDPFEPIPGGTMSLWPFELGKFVELPYTLVQDYTLTRVLNQSSPVLWLEKAAFLEQYFGMILLNSHPDYLKNPADWGVYESFLLAMKEKGYWQALPHQAAQWWKQRCQPGGEAEPPKMVVELSGGELIFSC